MVKNIKKIFQKSNGHKTVVFATIGVFYSGTKWLLKTKGIEIPEDINNYLTILINSGVTLSATHHAKKNLVDKALEKVRNRKEV